MAGKQAGEAAKGAVPGMVTSAAATFLTAAKPSVLASHHLRLLGPDQEATGPVPCSLFIPQLSCIPPQELLQGLG